MSSINTVAAAMLLALLLLSKESTVYSTSEDDTSFKEEDNILFGMESSLCSNTWFFKHNDSTNCECGSSLGQKIECNSTTRQVKLLHCFCMTYNEEDDSEVVGGCIYTCVPGIYGSSVYYPLHPNRSYLNQQVCGHYNRAGQLCGECRDMYAPPVYSYSVSCVECKNHDSNWLKFIAISFFPLTIFWFIVIVFRISATSGHLNAFVFISQILTSPQRNRSLQQAQAAVGWIKKVLVAFVTLHGIWNLDFFRLIYSPFCLHPRMSTIQAIALDYLIAVYPLILVVVTYLLVELHDYYMIVSWLWSPFKKCFLSIRREWNIRVSLINAFTTFLLLSYVKFLMVSVDLLIPVRLHDIHGKRSSRLYLYFGEVEYFGKEHLPYGILAVGVLLIFNIFPIMLLLLYTCRCFHTCLNRGRFNCQGLHMFMDSFQGCYKDGTEGTRDCRWFSAVYPLAQFIGLIVATVVYSVPKFWLSIFVFIHLVLLLILAVARPYKSFVHNATDCCLLFVSAVLYVVDVAGNTASSGRYSELAQVMHTLAGFLYLVPLMYLAGLALYKLLAHKDLTRNVCQRIRTSLPCNCKEVSRTDFEESLPDRLVHPEEYEPLLEPSHFKFDAESDVPLTAHEKKVLFDGHLAAVVAFSYNAKAVDGRLCLEASPLENQSSFVHSPHATLLEGVEPVTTTPFHSALHSLGGMQALYPLFSQLDLPQTSLGNAVDYNLSVKLLSLVFEMARNSMSFMLQLVQTKAVELISYLLEKVSPKHLCRELVSCIFDFVRYLSVAPSGSKLLSHLIEHLVFNAGLWSRAEQGVQIQLYSQVATEFSIHPLGTCGLDLREYVGVSQLLFILRESYGLTGEGAEVHAEVRPYLLLIIKEFVTKGKGIYSEELKSILSYLCTVPEDENLHDVLRLLLALVFEDPSTSHIIKTFEELDGLNVAMKLLACPSEELTLNALKLIGKVLHHSNTKHQHHLVDSVGLFSVLREKLLSAGQPMSTAMFNTLFEIFVNCPSRRIIDSHYLALDLSHQIQFPGILAVMIELICVLHTAPSEWEEPDTLMRMQLFSYVSSLCAQHLRNCKAILRLRHWQHWLLVLSDQQGAAEMDRSHLEEMVFKLLQLLLLHCFQEEQDGWRVWVETAAIMHAYNVTKAEGGAPLLPSSNLEGLSFSSFASFTEFHSSSDSSSIERIREELALPEKDDDTIESAGNSPLPQTGSVEDHTDGGEESGTGDLNNSQVSSASQVTQGALTGTEGEEISPKTAKLAFTDPTANVVQVSKSEEDSLQSFKELQRQDPPSPLLDDSPDTRATRKPRFPKSKPPPLTKVPTPPFSRTSSAEYPSSPFLIPRNPFLGAEGKMPKFQWSSSHVRLLEDLLKSLQKIMGRWKSGSPEKKRPSLANRVGEETNRYLRSNIAHLLALVTDNLIAMNGGLKRLLARSTSSRPREFKPSDSLRASQDSSLRYALSSDPTRAETLLRINLSLTDPVILSGLLKLSPVEAKMKMEGGGVLRQGLRLVLAVASQLVTKANTEHRDRHENYHREKQVAEQLHHESVAMMKGLGLEGSALVKYFHSSLKKKVEYLGNCQCLLTREFLTHLWNLIPSEGESKQVVQQLVVAEVYYLAVMCVAKYGSILDTTGREERDTGSENTVSLGSESGNVITEATQKTSSSASAESVPSTPEFDKALSFAKGIEQSILPSAFGPYVMITDVSDQVKVTLKLVGPFLCRLLLEHKTMLSKVFLAADGRQLLTEAALRLAENNSIVEMTMLLCSQEWQSSLQKYGGKAFNALLSEGRQVANFCESYLRSVASKTTTDFRQSAETQTNKFIQFEEQLSLFLSHTIRSSNDDLQLKRAEVKRYAFSAKETWRKVSSIIDEYSSPDFTLDKCCQLWKLDLRENASRKRVKLLPNPHGSQHEEAVRRAQPDLEGTEGEEGKGVVGLLSPPTQEVMAGGEEDSIVSEELNESLIVAELTSEQEQASRLKCQLVVQGRPLPGTLTLTPHYITFTADDSTEEYAKAAYLAEYCSINERWLVGKVRAVLLRRYLHQSKALEIFFADRSSVYFVFESLKEAKTVVRRLPKVGVGAEYGPPQSRSMSLASPQQLLRKSTMTAMWERREISNFEYLMFLNTIAGRSYNNLNQYPVFPWILTDYTSKTLDLNDPSVYRDLNKPIGTLNPTRLEKLEERFSCWDDDRIPPFLYGTHYSTMAFVLHWMVRVEPFSTLHINFHDGFFDQGSRLFYSLQESWNNCMESTSDVKELTPEFFYLPEMFVNENKFDLGKEGACEEGDAINDVILPPWASSAHDFIRIHREALESEYVSANLHHWIDLIFGYKQRGEEALKAKNVFYYLTYTGTIDLESISNLKTRKGLEDQICHFGQCPAQLLKEPHPSRQPATERLILQPTEVPNPKTPAVVAMLQVTPDVPLALVQLSASPGSSVLTVSYNQLYAVNKWNITAGTSTQSQVVSLEPDPQLASGLRIRLGDPLDQSISTSATCFAATSSNEVILVCGFWDNSFKCFAADSSQLVQSVFGHRDIVSCLDFSFERGIHGNPGEGLVATGSHDATVLLWRWSSRQNRVVGLVAGEEVDSPTPIAVLTGHEQSIACVSVNCNLGLTVSGAKYGGCLVHSNSGELLHKLVPSPQWVHPHMINIMRDGRIVVHYADQKGCLAMFSCNARQLCHCQLGDPALAMAISKDDRHIITGGFNCSIKVFSAHNLALKHSYEPFESSIRSLHISEDQRFIFTGLASGSIAVLATHVWLH